ncbi:hypothetical protein [Mesorhizobium sp. CAU 1732]|uniref:hypothetical protein n=1 Tax=Mesorhizobium sp. CAU 1732 TaxID=3140358 RepID=UPI0032604617
MISQMHAVQNAARMAMDHRAADPRFRRSAAQSRRFWWISLGVLALAVIVAAAMALVR